jgi:hypothetical protein
MIVIYKSPWREGIIAAQEGTDARWISFDRVSVGSKGVAKYDSTTPVSDLPITWLIGQFEEQE